MEEQLGSQGTIQCRMTLQNVIDQAIEDMEHGISDMVDGSVAQVSRRETTHDTQSCPVIRGLLISETNLQ